MTPTAIMLAMTEVPPPDRNGRVMPVTGIRPMVIAMFSKIWNRNMPKNPMTISAPYRSTESRMILVKRISRKA